MENKLPMIKKEGFFSGFLNKLKKIFSKKQIHSSEKTDEIEQVNNNTLTILDKNKGFRLEPHTSLTNSLEFASNKSNIQITNGKIDLTNMPLELQNNFLNNSIDVIADHICMLFDDEMIDGNEERASQKRKMFGQINHTLNMPRSMERMGSPMSEERKSDLYWGMLKNMFDYVKETVEFLDGQTSNQNVDRNQFIKSIEQKPNFVDPNNIAQGNSSREQNQR